MPHVTFRADPLKTVTVHKEQRRDRQTDTQTHTYTHTRSFLYTWASANAELLPWYPVKHIVTTVSDIKLSWVDMLTIFNKHSHGSARVLDDDQSQWEMAKFAFAKDLSYHQVCPCQSAPGTMFNFLERSASRQCCRQTNFCSVSKTECSPWGQKSGYSAACFLV